MAKLIQIAAAPNHGKSVLASNLYTALVNDFNVEFIQEGYKRAFYQEIMPERATEYTLQDITIVHRALSVKDVVIYDSSFISPICYGTYNDELLEHIEAFIYHHRPHSLCIHIPNMIYKFDGTARYQKNAEECKKINKVFKTNLEKYKLKYIEARTLRECISPVMHWLTR